MTKYFTWSEFDKSVEFIANKCKEIQVNIVDINDKRINQWNSDDLHDPLPLWDAQST